MSTNNKHIQILRDLIKEVGSQEQLAQELNKNGYKIGQSAISQWIARNKISFSGALMIEQVYKIPRSHLCP